MKTETIRTNVRGLALDTLIRVMDQDEYLDKALHQMLDKHSDLDKRDRAFLGRLVEGTVERCIEIDYVISRFSKTPLQKMKPFIRELLRMSVYQLMYMDQVPDSAACNEAVKLAQERKLTPLKSFVNGVLRNIARGYENLAYPSRKKDLTSHLSVWYSMPKWIVDRFLEQYGEETTERILQSFLRDDRSLCLRCNTAQKPVEQIAASLQNQGVQVMPGQMFPEALHITSYGRVEELEAFERGWVQVQDESSMLVGMLAPVRQDSFVIDVCAAPGGKSLHLADKMQGQGRIWACDLREEKVALIRQNLIRTGIHNVKLKKQDACVLREEWLDAADVVIADLPCSGLGVIGKKCDIKYKTRPQDIFSLAEKQRKILSVAGRYVKPGGYLIYSTCTMVQEENEQNVRWILENLPFHAVSIEDNLPDLLKERTGSSGYIQILPDDAKCDGFFVSMFQREN